MLSLAEQYPGDLRARLMVRRAEIVSALRTVQDRDGDGPSVVAQCMNVVAEELQRLVDELAPAGDGES